LLKVVATVEDNMVVDSLETPVGQVAEVAQDTDLLVQQEEHQLSLQLEEPAMEMLVLQVTVLVMAVVAEAVLVVQEMVQMEEF
jgi:hypothetical protein